MHPDVLSRFVRPAMANWWRTRGMWWVLAALLIQVLIGLHPGLEINTSTHVKFMPHFKDLPALIGWLLAASQSEKLLKLHERVSLDGILLWPRYRLAMLNGIPFLLAFWVGLSLSNAIDLKVLSGARYAGSYMELLEQSLSSTIAPMQLTIFMTWVLAIVVLAADARGAWLILTAKLVGSVALALQAWYWVPRESSPLGNISLTTAWIISAGLWLVSFIVLTLCLYAGQRSRRRNAWVISSLSFAAIIIIPSFLLLFNRVGWVSTQVAWFSASLWSATYSSPLHVTALYSLRNLVTDEPWLGTALQVLITIVGIALYLIPFSFIAYWFARLDRRSSVDQLALREEYA